MANINNDASGSACIEINLEAGRPGTRDAIERLRGEIAAARRRGIHCLYIIHGYGSSGRGGVIREEARATLERMKNSGTVKNYIKGEDFSIFNPAALAMKRRYPALDKLTRVCNHGVTVVEL